MKKTKCVVLTKDFKNNFPPYAIIGVFKNEKQAEKYLKWLDKDKSKYNIMHTSIYDYNNKPDSQYQAKQVQKALINILPSVLLGFDEKDLGDLICEK